jgi:hypothetical protein
LGPQTLVIPFRNQPANPCLFLNRGKPALQRRQRFLRWCGAEHLPVAFLLLVPQRLVQPVKLRQVGTGLGSCSGFPLPSEPVLILFGPKMGIRHRAGIKNPDSVRGAGCVIGFICSQADSGTHLCAGQGYPG